LILYLDDFGCQVLDRMAKRRGSSRAVVVRTASLYYLADRELERPAWRVRSFDPTAERPTGVSVRLDPETRRALADEANRQGVEPGALAAHAVLYYLADLDSARVADRLEQVLHPGGRV
jgi:predicted transcriptional regulator